MTTTVKKKAMKQVKLFFTIMSLLAPVSSFAQWEYQSPFSEGLAYVLDDNGKYGYIDEGGKLAIPCQWEHAEPFFNGVAEVTNEEWESLEIDKIGKVINR